MSYVLCVDDNEDMRLMVREVLASAGHDVNLAPDGLSALASIQEREPDLLVLDLVMPGMSGIDVCRAVKRNPFTARIPVLMLTAQSDIDSKVQGFEAGADDYLPKPFDPRELRSRVVALLRLVRREGDRNPTSGLPGGTAIEDEIARRAARKE
ncbi:MAG TPA: response regulator, partial [Gemmatimonadaceae bacterium]|nr:response regulator [Gemmatimonadaceae bacterium]